MIRFPAVLALTLFVACLWADTAQADPASVPVGAQRAVFSRNGTALVSEPKTLAKVVKMLPYGRRVRVDEVQGAWLRVTEFEGETAGATGWLRANKTVEPFAMTQGGQYRRTVARARGNVSTEERTAAGRQLDASSETKHKQASSAEIRAAYAALDKLEATKPTVEEIRTFRGEGRLGRPSVARVVKRPVEQPAVPAEAGPAVDEAPAGDK